MRNMRKRNLILLPLIPFLLACFLATVQAAERKVIHSNPPPEYAKLKNPLTDEDPKTLGEKDPNIMAGRLLYERTCARCHGIRGDGKGPEAVGFMSPIPPVNFTDPEAIAKVSQGYVKWRIDEGGFDEPFRSAMPSWKYDFTEDQKWQIILYVYKNAGVSPKR
ncbi:MAG: cytochrome c [Deltaproteobacteria bacterium]|nr:cytochrome c [Deltaproteobacteria bacterium]